MTPAQKLLGLVALAVMLMAGSAALTWQVQDWRYGKQLTEQAGLHQDDLTAFSNAAATQVRADQDKRLALEQRLSVSDQTHHKELTNAQTNQARLCDRLATSDLWLSVLVDAADAAGVCSVPAVTGTGGVVHGGARAQLNPAHAQRIIGDISRSIHSYCLTIGALPSLLIDARIIDRIEGKKVIQICFGRRSYGTITYSCAVPYRTKSAPSIPWYRMVMR